MFIARDRSHYREVPAFDPWFWKRHKRFFETSPEKSRPDLWILFWEEAVKTLQIMQSSSILPIPSRQELPLHQSSGSLCCFLSEHLPVMPRKRRKRHQKMALIVALTLFAPCPTPILAKTMGGYRCYNIPKRIGEEPSIQNFIALHQCYTSWLHILQTPGNILKMHKETIMLMGMRQ